MAEITPVTREEFYLAKAGGQDVPVPSAVTREEYYLKKLSNDSVVVPSPVTRREKFLYFACGGEIDLPSEDRMTRLERFIAKAGGMDVATPTAVTRLEKFWANVEGGGWKVTELTGALPITFRSNGTALIDYRIYGTANGAGVQTENKFDISSVVDGYINSNGVLTAGTQLQAEKTSDYIEIDSSTAYTISAVGGFPSLTGYRGWRSIAYYDSNKRFLARTASEGTSDLSATSGSTAKYVRISYRSFGVANLQIMLVQGSTPPETYIPYGYKLPLTVTSGAERKDADIYIGDSKLGAEEYADYESGKIVRNSTPQDPPLPLPAIETFKGENTLDSTEALGEVTIKGRIKEAE